MNIQFMNNIWQRQYEFNCIFKRRRIKAISIHMISFSFKEEKRRKNKMEKQMKKERKMKAKEIFNSRMIFCQTRLE